MNSLKKSNMSGECDTCSEHSVDCECKEYSYNIHVNSDVVIIHGTLTSDDFRCILDLFAGRGYVYVKCNMGTFILSRNFE